MQVFEEDNPMDQCCVSRISWPHLDCIEPLWHSQFPE
uniref:Uncharacterized protein n=1 Tax=Rhizophora mucronata TaxID=61149 RepID=A0A2P2N0G9_RHIMU